MTNDQTVVGAADDLAFASEVQAARRNRELITALAQRRHTQQFTQADVADRMRTSQSAVARLESHRHDPQLSTLARYVTALSLALDFTLVDQDTGEVTWTSGPTAKTTEPAADGDLAIAEDDQGRPADPHPADARPRSLHLAATSSGQSSGLSGKPTQRPSPIRRREDARWRASTQTATLAKAREDDEPLAFAPRGGTTVLRILLGAQLRRLREAGGISPEEAAHVIRAARSKIARLESGRVGFKDRDLRDLVSFYGVTDDKELQRLRELASRANAQDWWHDYSDILPTWFKTYIGLEEGAAQVRAYEVQFVHGLLQTPEYARAVTLIGHPRASDRELDRRIGLRLARQVVLSRPEPLALWVVLDEAVLRRPMGSPGIMRSQIKHLIEMAQRPNVTIQVAPFSLGGHAAAGGSFSLLRFAGTDLPDVVYLEQLASAIYFDSPRVTDSYAIAIDRLCAEALTPAASIKAMRSVLREM